MCSHGLDLLNLFQDPAGCTWMYPARFLHQQPGLQHQQPRRLHLLQHHHVEVKCCLARTWSFLPPALSPHSSSSGVPLTALILLWGALIKHNTVSPLDRRQQFQANPAPFDCCHSSQQHTPVAGSPAADQTLMNGALKEARGETLVLGILTPGEHLLGYKAKEG